jgi:predicted nucleic acid-binding protein
VLIDVFGGDERFGPDSSTAVRQSRADGSLVACDVVWAEVAGGFSSPAAAEEALHRLGVAFSPISAGAAAIAGGAWAEYRRRGGSRARLIPDFLIAAHALSHAETLLTRDRGFYGRYFPELRLLDPTAER